MPDVLEETTDETTEETEEQGSEQGSAEDDTTEDDADTFPRSYVVELRKESAGYREKAKTAEARVEEVSRQLFRLRVEALGKLADASDLEYDPALLGDDAALTAVVEDLVARKPHLKARKPTGDIGQGNKSTEDEPVDLMGMLRSRV